MTSSGQSTGQPLLDFLEDMRRLRRECPWKREQTHRSLARYLQEETAETIEAIDADDAAHLCEELGDLLLQVYFHAVIAEETGTFSLDDVARGIGDKMHRRNPHVFGPDGGPTELTAAEVDAQWQEIKAEERLDRLHDGEPSAYDGIAAGLPALLLATKILERVPDAACRAPRRRRRRGRPRRPAARPRGRGDRRRSGPRAGPARRRTPGGQLGSMTEPPGARGEGLSAPTAARSSAAVPGVAARSASWPRHRSPSRPAGAARRHRRPRLG